MERRDFLSLGLKTIGAATAANTASAFASSHSALPQSAERKTASLAAPGSFDFIFFTDTHIEPELAAASGCAMAFQKIRSLPADFAIQGGDHVFDALAVDRERATSLFDLYARTQHVLDMPVHHTIGNHDHFGLFAKSGASPADPGYGKRMYEERVGKTYYSFGHKGYHFVVLDTIQPRTDRNWEARIDPAQLDWLKTDLDSVPAGTPIVVSAHCPLVTAFSAYAEPGKAGGSGTTSGATSGTMTAPATPLPIPPPQLSVANAYEVLPLLEKHNVLAVLQGHTHINEVVTFRGIPYITSGAVCGNWWHGTRMGIPEGFTVVSLRDGKLSFRYETYGFQSVDPRNT